jgi:hypothetical protein
MYRPNSCRCTVVAYTIAYDIFIVLKQISLPGESFENLESNLTPIYKEKAENVSRHGREVIMLAL